MFSHTIEKEYKKTLKTLEITQDKIINSMSNLDDYLNHNYNSTKEERELSEDFYIILDIIRMQIKDSIHMLKKSKLEQNNKIVFLKSKEIEDIYVNFEYNLNSIFKRD